jgi:hypothetical protein
MATAGEVELEGIKFLAVSYQGSCHGSATHPRRDEKWAASSWAPPITCDPPAPG